MQANQALLRHLEEQFLIFFKHPANIRNSVEVKGGDINQCFLLDTDAGKFFVKLNASIYGLDFFEKEARGLVALASAGSLKVPQPLFDGKFHQEIYLVMEYIPKGQPGQRFWQEFAAGLSEIHRQTNQSFGWKESNYIGKLVQHNNYHASWAEFYTEERIMKNVKKALSKGLLDTEDVMNAESLCKKLAHLIPKEEPALLHGDLWSGNYMAIENGSPVIFDPAVYYGHRETDIAMTKLFGGFPDEFYNAYVEINPLSPDWEERIPLFQLYPLLVHLLLFGGHYRQSVTAILKKYS